MFARLPASQQLQLLECRWEKHSLWNSELLRCLLSSGSTRMKFIPIIPLVLLAWICGIANGSRIISVLAGEGRKSGGKFNGKCPLQHAFPMMNFTCPASTTVGGYEMGDFGNKI
jgi:hypothetical protein